MAERSKAWVCGRSFTEYAGSNPTGGMDAFLLSVLCVVRQRFLRRTDHSYRGVIPTVVVFVRDREASTMREPWPSGGCRGMEKNNNMQERNSSLQLPFHIF